MADGNRIEVRALGSGVFHVSADGQQRLLYAAGPPDARWVFVEGRVFVIDTTRSGTSIGTANAVPTREDDLALSSPMPATVSAIRVVAGQQVARGDLLVMLEAMKMELPIRAPRDGRVARILCSHGELVQPGTSLVELE